MKKLPSRDSIKTFLPRPELFYLACILTALIFGFYQEGLLFSSEVSKPGSSGTQTDTAHDGANTETPLATLPDQANPPSPNLQPTKNPQPGSLANTLDSINAGAADEAQIARRQTYFNKLSQQLDTLQGEAPTTNSPTNSPINSAINSLPGSNDNFQSPNIIPNSGGGFGQATPTEPDEEEEDAEEDFDDEEEVDDAANEDEDEDTGDE